MNPKMLRRRADKRCGSDVAPFETSPVNHPTINPREPETTPSTHHHRKRLPLRESIESSRSHPTPFKPNTEIEASRRSAPLTEIELRSPYNGISTHPNKPEPKKSTNPKTRPRDQSRRGKAAKHFHPPGARPTTTELRSLRLPETNPSNRTRNLTAPSSQRPRPCARGRTAMDGLVPEFKQGGQNRRRNRGGGRYLYGWLEGSGDGTRADAPPVTGPDDRSTFSFLNTLSLFKYIHTSLYKEYYFVKV
ncbi:hypothetical protein HID58_068702 [Brassica napus]|uniref:Uncharacterized protein n=1 Tax=Brassica napus TaxID=3708 RepID=A0ABQ7ZMG0_BRANA|nr:hypothetical protein HID58_068702 [Brassica napus]